MNMKNTMILFILLISILGLIIGVYYSEDIDSNNPDDNNCKKIYEDHDGVLTITLEKNDENNLNKYFT